MREVRGSQRDSRPLHPKRKGNAPASNATCNRYMASLRRAFSLGREKLELLDVAMSVSNHRTPSVFLRYGIGHESSQRAALEQVDALLRGLESKRTMEPMAQRARGGRRRP